MSSWLVFPLFLFMINGQVAVFEEIFHFATACELLRCSFLLLYIYIQNIIVLSLSRWRRVLIASRDHICVVYESNGTTLHIFICVASLAHSQATYIKLVGCWWLTVTHLSYPKCVYSSMQETGERTPRHDVPVAGKMKPPNGLLLAVFVKIINFGSREATEERQWSIFYVCNTVFDAILSFAAFFSSADLRFRISFSLIFSTCCACDDALRAHVRIIIYRECFIIIIMYFNNLKNFIGF